MLRLIVEPGARLRVHDEIGAPLACVSETRYPGVTSDALGMVLALADGGCLATWQGDRL